MRCVTEAKHEAGISDEYDTVSVELMTDKRFLIWCIISVVGIEIQKSIILRFIFFNVWQMLSANRSSATKVVFRES